MAFIKFIFLTAFSWGLSAFNFIPPNDASFNTVLYQKQIEWGVKKYLPTLSNNLSFQEHFKKFITEEKNNLFLTSSNPSVVIPKYFFRFKAKDNLQSNFELGLITSSGTGSLWNEKGRVTEISFYTNPVQAPETCPSHASKKFLYAEYNSKTSVCSSFFVEDVVGHPLYLYSIKAILSDETTYSLHSPKVFYPGVITGGNTSVYTSLRKAWRLVFSRVQNLEDHSIVYFP
ncbi:MAG: hypothetical protein ACRBBP_06435 [Bdellovibrionales bacterium]